MSKSIDEFRELLESYDQQVIQPVIDEILANFEQDLNKFQASTEAWSKLATLKEKLSKNYQALRELIKNGYIKSQLASDEINSFFPQNIDNIDLLYQYKKLISDIFTKSSFLLELKENELAYKPVHFIFAFIHKAQEIKQLIDKYNLNVEDKADNNSFIIHSVALMGNQQGLELLLNNYKDKVDINVQNSSHQSTPLHLIAFKGHAQLLPTLLKYPNIQINIQNNRGNTPLHIAIINGWSEVVKSLVSANSDLNINNNIGNDPLHLAVIVGYTENFKILLDHLYKQGRFINIDEFDDNGRTLLHHAVHHGNELMIRFLVEKYKANINSLFHNGVTSTYPLFMALANEDYNIAKYLLEYGTLINNIESIGNMLFAKTICYITKWHKEKFASSDKLDKIYKSGIFNNSNNIIGFIKNWAKFDLAYQEYSTNNSDNNNILKVNEYKILEAQHLIKNIMQFFHHRQEGLHQLFLQGKLQNLMPNEADGNFAMHQMNKMSYQREINWQKLEDNLFYKYVLHNIMSGEIALYDQIVSSDKIASELGLFIKIFLIHKSRLINQEFEYQGEVIDQSKTNLSVQEQNIISNRSQKNGHKNDYDLYPIDLPNYQIIESWKNIIFFKQILVGKHMNIISPEDYLKNKKIELIMLIAGDKIQDASKIVELTNICKDQDISGLIQLPLEVWRLVASYLDLAVYSKFLSTKIAVEEKKTQQISNLMEEYVQKTFDMNSFFEPENHDKIRAEYAKIIGENSISSETDLTS